MRILALDSSGLVASAAVVEAGAADEITIAEYTVNYKKTHSQTLLPMLDEIARMVELDLDTIDAIAVAAGPGSFTGLRIGSATAKGLGMALKKPLIHVPTLEGLAYNLCGTDKIVCPIMDARRGQVYTGIYEFEALVERIMAGRSISFAPAHMNRQRAASVGALGIRYYRAGKIEAAADHQPNYLRVSQAERERRERLGHD